MEQFKIIRYFFRDKVDIILLLTAIAFMVKDFGRFSFLGVVIMYILCVMWRMGTAMDNLNEYVTDKDYRQQLKLYPVPGVIPRRRKTIFAIIVDFIFWIGLISVFVFFIMQ